MHYLSLKQYLGYIYCNVICLWYTRLKVDTLKSFDVCVTRSTFDPDILDRAAQDVHEYFSLFPDFYPGSAFIATWEKVGAYRAGDSRVSLRLYVINDNSVNLTLRKIAIWLSKNCQKIDI